jgi:class 3 adenylate cyclase
MPSRASRHGFVAKYLGDGVLAYFGYPRAHEEDAEQAVRASLAVIEIVIADNTRRMLGGLFDYRDLGASVIAGLDHPVHVWRVLGASLVGSRFEALRAASTARRWLVARKRSHC